MKRNRNDENDQSSLGFFGFLNNLFRSFFSPQKPKWIKLHRAEYPEVSIKGMPSYQEMKFYLQREEIEYLQRNKDAILKNAQNLEEFKVCFDALNVIHTDYQKRETELDNLNAAIIRQQITVSKAEDPTVLFCNNVYATRLPAILFMEDKDYWLKLERLYLARNRIIELPSEICQLISLKYLNLLENQIGVLPESLKELSSLEEVHLPQDIANYYGESIHKDYLPSCPFKAPLTFGELPGVCFQSKEKEPAVLMQLQRKSI